MMKSERVNQKKRTRRVLLEAAARLIRSGASPSVSEAADAAGVSRRTAYRYFQSTQRLHADAALETLRPAMEMAIESSPASISVGDVETRLSTWVDSMQRLTLQNEQLLRTMIHETVLTPGPGSGPRRGTRRIDWIESAIKPLRSQLDTASYKRLVSALALCTGIESLLVMRDICGLSAKEATKVAQWMCQIIVRESVNENRAGQRKRKRA